jgi:hypothetical protein
VNPRMSDQVISHVIDPVMASACTTASIGLASLAPGRACYFRRRIYAGHRDGSRPGPRRILTAVDSRP